MMDGKRILQFATEQGLAVGACRARRWSGLLPILEKKNKALIGFCEQDIEKRVNPKLFLEEAETILLFLLPYGKQYSFSFDGALRGQLSMSAVGTDYHLKLEEALSTAAALLQEEEPGLKYRIFVDTGPFVEREVAVLAGLGYLGKNGALIHPQLGSMVFIGGIALNKRISFSSCQGVDSCGDCALCIKTCPGKAFAEDGFFRPHKCLSYLTQTKVVLTEEEMRKMGRRLYGCDVCQLVCPKNGGIQKQEEADIEQAMPLLLPFLTMSHKEFYHRYGKTAIGWRGRNILRRNAIIALGNYRTEEAAEILFPWMQADNTMIRRTAQQSYALCRGRKG